MKNIEIQNFNPKNGLSLRMYENIRVPPPFSNSVGGFKWSDTSAVTLHAVNK